MRALFLSPPATSLIGGIVSHEAPAEVPLPRIPFQVLAHALPGWQCEVADLDWELDMRPDRDLVACLAGLVANARPDVVLTTAYAQGSLDAVDQIVDAVREVRRDLPTVVGGQSIPHLGRKVFDLVPGAQVAVIGGGELASAVEAAQQGARKALVTSGPRMGWGDLGLGISQLASFPVEEMREFYRSRGAELVGYIETHRGCPYPCEFCAARRRIEYAPLERTLAEIMHMLSRGIESFYVIDLTFGMHRKRTVTLLDRFRQIRRRFPRFRFRCITRPELVTGELTELLVRAGCVEVGLGVETGSDEVLRIQRKGNSREDGLRAIDRLGRAGIRCRLFLMLGMTDDELRIQSSLLEEAAGLNRDLLIQPSLYRAIRGQGLMDDLDSGRLARGRMHQLDFRCDGRWAGRDNVSDVVNFLLLSLAWPSTEFSGEGDRGLRTALLAGLQPEVLSGIRGTRGLRRAEDMVLIRLGRRRVLYRPAAPPHAIRQGVLVSSPEYFEYLALADGTRSPGEIGATIDGMLSCEVGVPESQWPRTPADEIRKRLLHSGMVSAA